MQTKEERDAYYHQRDIDRKRTIHEHKIAANEIAMSKLFKAKAMAVELGDEAFVGAIEAEIIFHRKEITKHRREIILEATGVILGNGDF